jgi:hypothetical protein
MIVYFLPSVSGLTRWVDYIPVKFTTVATAATENTYNQNGYIPVVSLSSIAGATPFKEYVPVFLDSSAADADVWDVTITGFIPVGTAGIGGAALYLDFAATTSLDPRITFSRTTNATVTGSNGLIRNAPMNLLTFSEQFDNAVWVKTGSTVSANNTAAPNGTITADKLVETAATGIHEILQPVNVANGAISVNFYAKAAERSKFRLDMTDLTSGDSFADFDLTSVSATSGSNGSWSNVSTTIVSAGDGWYRCNMTATKGAGTTVGVKFQLNNGGGISYAGTAGSGLFIWGAQLEVGSTATTYNPTTVKNLLGYTEHFDNAAWTKSNAFVQTNLLTYSEQFDNAAWSKTIATVTANSVVAPDGSTTADSVAVQSPPATSYMVQTSTNTSGAFSVFAKSNPARYLVLVRGIYSSGDFAIFDIINGTVTQSPTYAGSSAVITQDVNGWFRCVLLSAQVATINGISVSGSGTGTSTQASGAIAVWGAQLVQGTTPGDYKATYAAAAAVGYTDIYGQPFAQKLVENTSTNDHSVYQQTTVTAGATINASAYCKAGERSFAAFLINDLATGPFQVFFDLTTGVTNVIAGNGWSNIVAAATAVGNGWYRCSVTAKETAVANNVRFQICTASSNSTYFYTGDGTSGIYIFGAQLSDSASVDPYVYNPVAAPTSTAYYGPRFDYDPVTLAPKGLLIEEQRTNLLVRSEEFDNASWVKNAATVTANATVSPAGTLTADTVTDNAANAGHAVYGTTVAVVAATTYTTSVYLKAGTLRYVSLRGESTATGAYPWITVDLQTGAVNANASVTSSSASFVGNGWYRVALTFVNSTSQANANMVIASSNVSTAPTPASVLGNAYVGTGTGTFFVWGAQLEAGAFATSYIPTVASQVTRAADNVSMIGNNFARWYTQGPGSMFAEVQSVNGVSSRAFTVSDSTISNQIFEANDTLMNVYTGGAFQVQTGGTGIAGKVAMAYAANDFAVVKNGGSVTTDTSGSLASAYTQLNIGVHYNNTAGHLNGALKRISYYPRRLANTELQGITS